MITFLAIPFINGLVSHGLQGATKQVRFQPRCGKLLATAARNSVSLIDVETDSLQFYLKVNPAIMECIRFCVPIFCMLFLFFSFRDIPKMFFQFAGMLVGSILPLSVKIVHAFGQLCQVENAYMNFVQMATNSSRARFILDIHSS